MDKQDSAISVVIIFVMVLAVLAVIISLWALLGVPGQIEEIDYHHSFNVENGLADFQSMMYSVFNFQRSAQNETTGYLTIGKSGIVNVVNTMLIPVGWSNSAGNLQLKQNVGTFSGIGRHLGVNSKTPYTENYNISVDRLSIKLGRDCEIGLEGGGVFRRDGDSAQWIIRPFFDTVDNDYALMMTQFTPDSTVGISTSSDVSLNVWYTGETDEIHGGGVTYTSQDGWDMRLWYNFFYEVHSGGSTLVPLIVDPYNEGDTSFTINLRKGIRSPEFGIELTPLV